MSYFVPQVNGKLRQDLVSKLITKTTSTETELGIEMADKRSMNDSDSVLQR